MLFWRWLLENVVCVSNWFWVYFKVSLRLLVLLSLNYLPCYWFWIELLEYLFMRWSSTALRSDIDRCKLFWHILRDIELFMNNDVIGFWFSLISSCIISDKLFWWIFGNLWTEAAAAVELYDWLWHLCFLVLARNLLGLLYYPWHYLFLVYSRNWWVAEGLLKRVWFLVWLT